MDPMDPMDPMDLMDVDDRRLTLMDRLTADNYRLWAPAHPKSFRIFRVKKLSLQEACHIGRQVKDFSVLAEIFGMQDISDIALIFELLQKSFQ